MPALDRARTIQAAEKFVKAGKLTEAVKEYQKLADDNPRDMNVMNKLGDLLARAGRNAEALRHFVRIADFYARDGFFLKAIAMYKKVTKLDPANIESQQRLASMYIQQGLASEARAQYLQLADQLVRQNQIPGAIDALRQVLEVEADNTKVRLALADLLVRGGKAEEAGREYCHLARAASARGELAEAVEALRRAVQASPGLPGLPGLMLSLVSRVEAAPAALVAAAEEMSRQDGRSAMVLLVLGETLRRAGRAGESDEAYRRLLGGVETTDDLTAEALLLLARHHEAQGRLDPAWDAVERALGRNESGAAVEPAALVDDFIARHPEHRQALTMRAAMAARAGDAAAETAALRRLAAVLVAAGDTERAGEVLQRLGTLAPGDAEVARLSGELAGAARTKAAVAPAVDPVAAAGDEPALVDESVEDEIEVILVESEEPVTPERAAEETRAAEEIFNIEDAASAEPAADAGGAAAAGEGPAKVTETPIARPIEAEAAAEAEEEAYGPSSRIQEIQAADDRGLPIDEDFISEHLTEAEVFVKYGLHGKAREQLQAILARYPDHETARIRLKDLLVGEGSLEAAIRECLAIADLLREKGREAEARELINEAVRLDPDSPLVVSHRGSVAVATASASFVHPAVRGAALAVADPLAIADGEDDLPVAPPATAPAEAPSLGEEWLSADKDIEIEVARAEPPVEPDLEATDFASTTARTVLPAQGERVDEHVPAEAPPVPLLGGGDVPDAVEMQGVFGGSIPPEEPADSGSLADLIGGLDEGPMARALAATPRRDPDDEKLGEVDFYIEQGLVDEARQVLFQLGRQYPGSAAVSERMARLDGAAGAPAAATPPDGEGDLDFEVEQALAGKTPQPRTSVAGPRPADTPRAAPARPVFKMEKHSGNGDGAGEFIDLGAEISRTLAEEPSEGAVVAETIDGQAHSFDDIFAAFKKGVAQQVESTDFETHYNLGIAYKEMGLVDEAIGEFQFAAKDPSRTLECCGILGLCFRDKGMPELALRWYKRGLDMPGLDEQQSLGLRYDMAEAYREKGDFDEALKAYIDVYGIDSTYREVAARVQEMKKRVPGAAR